MNPRSKRIREREHLTAKPVVYKSISGWWAMRNIDHRTSKLEDRCQLLDTFPEAIEVAAEWAGPKVMEAP